MKENLGIYFGVKGIEIVYSEKGRIITFYTITRDKYITQELEDKVPSEVKITTLIKEFIRKNNITTKEVNVSLSGKDILVRSFELPMLPKDELITASNFEVKKYLPFKLEEMIFDFQFQWQPSLKKVIVLFLGIRRDVLNFYTSLIKGLGLQLITLEYAGFSLLKFHQKLHFSTKGTLVVLNMDTEDEINFIVLENFFPLFNRDIYLQEADKVSLEEKLKSEFRLCLDYYSHRKFPSKPIEKIFVLGESRQKNLVDLINQETELDVEFIPLSENITRSDRYSLGIFKAFATSPFFQRKVPFNFNLMEALEKNEIISKGISLQYLKPSFKTVLLCIFILLLGLGLGFYPRLAIKEDLNKIAHTQSKITPNKFINKTLEELKSQKILYESNLIEIKKLVDKYAFLYPQLNSIAKIIPRGLWLTDLRFSQGDKKDLYWYGMAYLKDMNREINLVNDFVLEVKRQEEFKIYKNIELVNVERAKVMDKEVTQFVIQFRE